VTRPGSFRKILGLLREELPALSAGTALLVAGAALTLVYPQGIRIIVDGAIEGQDPRAVTRIAIFLGVLAVVQGLAVAGRHLLFSLAGERGVRRVRERLYQSLLSQEIAFFDASRTGELVSRLGTDCAAIQSLVSAHVSMAFRHLITALGALGLLFFTSGRLTLVMLAVVPAVAIGGVAYGRKVRALARRYQDALADASHVAEESLSAIRTVRAFNAEAAETARYEKAIGESYDAARKRVYAGSTFMGAASAGGYVAVAVVLGYGGILVSRGELSAGALTAFLVYTLFIAMSLGALADLWAEAMRGLGAADRVFALMDRVPGMGLSGGVVPARPSTSSGRTDFSAPRASAGSGRAEVQIASGRTELETFRPATGARLTFEDVRFSYPTRPEVEVLSGIDLDIAPGEVVALVGASGGGKSTVAALVARLYDPTSGRIVMDGHDLRDLDPTWLRAQIGVVPQEPVLFSASVEENVRYGRPGASREEVVAACHAAHADAFVRAFPQGYETKVGERGQQLSGGQRQRIAIARAVLKDPRVLLLDEATSALDAESEALVQDALERLMVGRTAIVIAHRLSTVARADRVLVLDGGKVVESGAHGTLMAAGGIYRRLVERQLLKA
jgi:ABC-type multidrug transport system fused ATPase/permease subunit